MITKALVWIMTGILVASMCSALVQDCDNCDHNEIKNKFCCQRKAEIWDVEVNPQADRRKKICCDFTGDTIQRATCSLDKWKSSLEKFVNASSDRCMNDGCIGQCDTLDCEKCEDCRPDSTGCSLCNCVNCLCSCHSRE